MPDEDAGTEGKTQEPEHKQPDEREQAKSLLAEALEPIQSSMDEIRKQLGQQSAPKSDGGSSAPPKSDGGGEHKEPRKKTFAERWFG